MRKKYTASFSIMVPDPGKPVNGRDFNNLILQFFMAIFWSIHLIMTIFCYYDLDSAPNSSFVDPDHEIASETSSETVSQRPGTNIFTVYQGEQKHGCFSIQKLLLLKKFV